MIIYLVLQLPASSSDTTRKAPATVIPPLFGLAPDGVYLAGLLPDRWCALTAPFHPYLQMQAVHISVALSLRSPSPDVIRHPALWSSDFPHLT